MKCVLIQTNRNKPTLIPFSKGTLVDVFDGQLITTIPLKALEFENLKLSIHVREYYPKGTVNRVASVLATYLADVFLVQKISIIGPALITDENGDMNMDKFNLIRTNLNFKKEGTIPIKLKEITEEKIREYEKISDQLDKNLKRQYNALIYGLKYYGTTKKEDTATMEKFSKSIAMPKFDKMLVKTKVPDNWTRLEKWMIVNQTPITRSFLDIDGKKIIKNVVSVESGVLLQKKADQIIFTTYTLDEGGFCVYKHISFHTLEYGLTGGKINLFSIDDHLDEDDLKNAKVSINEILDEVYFEKKTFEWNVVE